MHLLPAHYQNVYFAGYSDDSTDNNPTIIIADYKVHVNEVNPYNCTGVELTISFQKLKSRQLFALYHAKSCLLIHSISLFFRPPLNQSFFLRAEKQVSLLLLLPKQLKVQ